MRARLMSGERLTAFARRAPTILTINTTSGQIESLPNGAPLVLHGIDLLCCRSNTASPCRFLPLVKPLPVGSIDTLEGGHQRAHAVAELG
jgi:hypothetical protein